MSDYLSYQVLDEAGSVSTVVVYLQPNLTLAEKIAFSDLMAVALDDVTGGVINAARVTTSLALPSGLKSSPTAGHFLQVGANFAFDAANTPYRHTVRVPGALESEISGETFDTSPGSVGKAFADLLVNGDGNAVPADRYENDLTGLLSARVTFRK